MTNNENWQENSYKRNSSAGRDGKPYEKRDVKSILKVNKGAAKFNTSQPGNDDYSSKKLEFRKKDDVPAERRSFGNRFNSGESKPFRSPSPNRFNPGGERNFNSDRPSFNRDRNFNNDRSTGGERSYNNDRPYNNDRSTGGDRSYNNDRPRTNDRPYNNDRGGNRFQSRDRFNNSDNQGGRPRFSSPNRFNNDEQSDSPRFSVRKPGEGSGYTESNFNNQDGRRPRFRRPSEDYDPNAKYSKKKQIEYRRNEVDFTKPVRLNKFLANAGICSRREADEFIKAGVITVNGEFVTEMGVKVMHSDKVLFHNQLVRSERKVYILLNKPKDTVTTSEDTHDRRTVLDLVKNACSERIYPVGRLDRNTTGVLLLTNDGDLASKLTHPKYDKKKIYHVALDKVLEQADFDKVLAGVQLDDDTIAADSLNYVNEEDFKQVGIEIHSGQNRVVRRIFEKLGYKVVRLDRVYFAGLTKKSLPRGKYRFLSEKEVNMLKMGAYE